jgi:hypothetical protein
MSKGIVKDVLGRKSNQATEESWSSHPQVCLAIAENSIPALAEASPTPLTRSLSRRDAEETTALAMPAAFLMRAILIFPGSGFVSIQVCSFQVTGGSVSKSQVRRAYGRLCEVGEVSLTRTGHRHVRAACGDSHWLYRPANA